MAKRKRLAHERRKAEPVKRGPVYCPTEPIAAARLLEIAEELEWYALRIAPHMEFRAQEILSRRGIVTYCPADRRWRRPNGVVRSKRLRSFPLMPGYVFGGFVPGRPVWFDLFAPPVIGVVGWSGTPRAIPTGNMIRMIRSYRNGLARPTEERHMQTYREFQRGDVVRITAGPLEDFQAPVVSISGPHARLLLGLFGVEREIEVPSAVLERVA